MNQPITYREYLHAIENFTTYEDVEEVDRAVIMAGGLPHWFDRQRAVTALAERLQVDESLLFRMMTRGNL